MVWVTSVISIHALLAESDDCKRKVIAAINISIHALLAESDRCPQGWYMGNVHFYPRSPCGERRSQFRYNRPWGKISIHALLAESDRQATPPHWWKINFYPRSPCGERRGRRPEKHHQWHISIHALLAESDPHGGLPHRAVLHFYPRSPCGERPIGVRAHLHDKEFLSTLSLRRATDNAAASATAAAISIHALLAESDTKRAAQCTAIHYFYPRSPCGERLHALLQGHFIVTISIHALLAESDVTASHNLCPAMLFLSTLSLRRATQPGQFLPTAAAISIHALLAESDTVIACHLVLDGLFLSTLSLRRATMTLPLMVLFFSNFYPRSPCGERRGA